MSDNSSTTVSTLVLALELSNEQVMNLARQLATLRESTRAFVPMLVSSCSSLKAIRELGLFHEYVISYKEWSASRDPATWSTYVLNRVKLISAEVGPGNILIAGDLLRARGIDRNLYGALLTLTPSQRQAPEVPAVIGQEIASINLNVAALDERLKRIDRAIHRLAGDPAESGSSKKEE